MKDLKLGDKLEKLIDTVVPKRLKDMITKGGCGCSDKKDWLNGLTIPDRLRQLEEEKRQLQNKSKL